MRQDASRTGRLDKKTFTKAITQLPIQLADDAIEILFSTSDNPNQLDIKTFVDKVVAASKYNPLPSTLTQK
jgi:hypothetical protein